MASGRTYLGLDLGTSGLKAVTVDGDGRLLAEARADYPLSTPAPGWTEAEPQLWLDAAVAAVAELRAQGAAEPSVIGLSGQMHGVVLTGVDGQPLRPAMLWPDTRATAQLDRYHALPPDAVARLANPVSPGMAGPLLCWLADHEPELLRATRWALQPKDWLRLQLTGQAHGEPSDASGTLLYDVGGDRWDTAVVDVLGLDAALLAPLASSTSVVGGLTATTARALALPPDLPVAAGAADTAAAGVGTGLGSEDAVQLTVGTGGQLVRPLAVPRGSPETGTHLYRAATTGWYAMAATLNAGLALAHVRSLVGASWDELYGSAAGGVVVDDPLFLPHLAGERTPHLEPRLRGGFAELSLEHDRTVLLRSALEGVAHALRDALDALPDSAGVDHLRLAGGGTRHPAWRQLLADVLGRPLHAVDAPSASARGAALLGAVALGDATEDDLSERLAPPATLVAEPRDAVAGLHADRLARYRHRVATELAGLGDPGG